MDFSQYFTATIIIKFLIMISSFYIDYYIFKQALTLKKPFEIILNDLAWTPLQCLYLSIVSFLTTTIIEIPKVYGPSFSMFCYYITTFALMYGIGFFIGWKSTASSGLYIKNIDEAIIYVPTNRYFYYSFLIFWAIHFHNKMCSFLPLHSFSLLLLSKIILNLLTGMFWARFFYAYQEYKKTKLLIK